MQLNEQQLKKLQRLMDECSVVTDIHGSFAPQWEIGWRARTMYDAREATPEEFEELTRGLDDE